MLEKLMQMIVEFAKSQIRSMQRPIPQIKPVDAVVPTSKPVPAPKPTISPAKYLWDTKTNIRHSIRVICDEEGLTVEQKNTMCATIQAESGFVLTAVNHNRNSVGKVTSTDYGLCQWNDYYHGKEITPGQSVHDPEMAVRLMCSYWKRGQRELWIAYKNGSYKRYL